jgi:hypothetical protein
MLTGGLHGNGDRYSVLFDGKLIVERSHNPECDAARALLALGHTGKLTMLNGKTGRPRTFIDIEKAAKLTVEERPRGPRFEKRIEAVPCQATSIRTNFQHALRTMPIIDALKVIISIPPPPSEWQTAAVSGPLWGSGKHSSSVLGKRLEMAQPAAQTRRRNSVIFG